jgi:glyoxylase-like metal-dependent hydrolase (beta-lactamase superfamily II)
LGDVTDSLTFEYERGPGFVPGRTTVVLWEREHNWKLEQHKVSGSGDVPPDSLFAAPKSFEPEVETNAITPDAAVLSIAPGIWLIDMPDLETRSLVVEFADHLAVIEASTGSANGERIVDVAKRHWPSKPIRYFLFSHFHPHYLGGVRAFIAEGATIVTTPGNESVVRKAAARPFTMEPDRLARSPRAPDIRVFSKRIELADSTNTLVGIDIGERSDHTAEFTIFWLPRQKVVFEAEQGWASADGKTRAIRRTKKFLQTLQEENIAADRFAQSWPMKDAPASLTRAELDSLLVPRKP